MNRLVTSETAHPPEASLPPRTPGDRARVLFVSLHAMGVKTQAMKMEEQTAAHDGIEAVHLRMVSTGLWRQLGRRVPGLGAWSFAPMRGRLINQWAVRPFVSRLVEEGRLDVICSIGYGVGRELARHCVGGRPALAAYVDATTSAHAALSGEPMSFPIRVMDDQDRAFFRSCDLIAGWSRWVVSSLVKDYGVEAARTRVVPPGVVVKATHPRLARIAAKGASPLPRIAFVGNDWERKGGPKVVRWHQERWREKAELHVMSDRAPADPSAKNVVWHGSVDNTRLVEEVLPSMDLFVLPTRMDMSPVAIAEAQAAGLPAIINGIAGTPDLVSDGESGRVVEIGDDRGFVEAVESLLNDPGQLERFSRAAYDFAQRSLDTNVVHRAWLDELAALGRRARARRVPSDIEGKTPVPVPVHADAAPTSRELTDG